MNTGKKVLYIATSDIHIQTFHLPHLEWLHKNKFIVDLVVESRGGIEIPYITSFFNIAFPRKPDPIVYFLAYRKLRQLICRNFYDIIHCHTPLPSFIARLAAKKMRKRGTKVIYTAHGFHFFKGAPVLNWLIFFPVELILSRFTDCIITMNNEDYWYVKKHFLNPYTFIIHGMGVDPSIYKKLNDKEKAHVRKDLGFTDEDMIIIYVAEFTYRKNHKFIIEALSGIKGQVPNIKIIFTGKGPLLEKTRELARKRGLNKIISFLGFRNDIPLLTGMADIGISSSRREGLPIGILQEMFCGLPVVATSEKGHLELIKHGLNGYLFRQDNIKEFQKFLIRLANDTELRKLMGQKSLELASRFSVERSVSEMGDIYKTILKQDSV